MQGKNLSIYCQLLDYMNALLHGLARMNEYTTMRQHTELNRTGLDIRPTETFFSR